MLHITLVTAGTQQKPDKIGKLNIAGQIA